MNNRLKNVLIGSDIECFFEDTTKKEICSAEGYVKGTKHNPFCFDKKNKYFATSLDNVLAEFCIPPTFNKDEFVANISKSLNFIKSTLPPQFNVVHLASAFLKDEYLQTENAKLFGCESDFCVWTRSTNEKPSADANLRSAGFHIHVGMDNPTNEVVEEIIKAADLFLGVPSVLLDPDTNRRKLYGKAGAFRFKEYGCEYRTLSGYFLNSKELIEWVFDNSKLAVEFVDSANFISEQLGLDIQNSINNNDKKLAEKIVTEFNIPMV
jgi:hypothetical protein